MISRTPHHELAPVHSLGFGRSTPSGQSALSGQLSENHCMTRSNVPVATSESLRILAKRPPDLSNRSERVDSATLEAEAYVSKAVMNCSRKVIMAHINRTIIRFVNGFLSACICDEQRIIFRS